MRGHLRATDARTYDCGRGDQRGSTGGYREARTTVDAERAPDELAVRGAHRAVPIGDLYDELAEAAAEEDDYDAAARLERKALEGGCTGPLLAREMLGWYLLKSGALEQGERVFGELRAERPDDVELVITLGRTPGWRTARCARSTKRCGWPSASA